MSGLSLIAHAIPQVEGALRGIHVLWSGPVGWGYAPAGYIVERRTEVPRPAWQCLVLDAAGLAAARRVAEIASVIGPVRIHSGAAPVTLATGTVPIPATWEVLAVELASPTDAVRVVASGKWMQAVAFARGKPVAASALTPNTLTAELFASQIDAVKVYGAPVLSDVRVCADRTSVESWSTATVIARLQLPLVELDPTLGGPAGELDLARKRLVPGETMTAAELADGLAVLRALVRGRSARPIDHTLLVEDELVDGQRVQPTELSGTEPLRALFVSPRWRRVLGLAYFDRDPALVLGTRYQYRVRAAFPASDRDDRVIGFHTVPSQTLLPAELAIDGAQLRFGQPTPVVLDRASPGPGVTVARRGVRLEDAGARGPWWAAELDGHAVVIDLAAPARSITLELAGAHDLRLWAGNDDTPVLDVAVPPGPAPRIDLPALADQLRLSGKGLLCTLRARPDLPPSGTVELAAATPPVVLAMVPPPPAPLSLAAVSLQTAGSRKPSELGFDVTWLPAPITGITTWPPDLPPPPSDAAMFQLERRLEPSGAWLPVIEDDNLLGGGRDAAPVPAALSPGVELMEVFPEVAPPAPPVLTSRWRDTFETLAAAQRPLPGTQHRYRIRGVDGLGRVSAVWTTGAAVTLEKHVPPPVPGAFAARALVAGAPDLTAADVATLAGHGNALVMTCRWGEAERARDPGARELRFYYARRRLDAIAATTTAVTALGSGAYQVAITLAEDIAANASIGLRLTGAYPFAITQHTAGTAITAVVRAAIPDATGGYPVPALGAGWFPVRVDAQRRRPRRFATRAQVQTIDARTDYTAVFHDVFSLSAAHPEDRLLVGASAADAEPYVPDDLAPAATRPGNEGALATAMVTARDAGQPVLAEAPAITPVAALATPVPGTADLRATIDLGPLIAGLGLPPGEVRLERTRDTAIAAAYRVSGTSVIAVPPEPAQPGEVEAAIAIANPGDRAAIVAALGGTGLDALADRYLVYLAAAHPLRARLFVPSHDRTSLPIVDDTWPPSGARWVYRARALDAAGRVSADGRTLRGVVRVPTPAPPSAPHHVASGPAPAFELRYPAANADRLLAFAVDVALPASGTVPLPALVALSGRTDGATYALRMPDATLVLPVHVIPSAQAPLAGDERIAIANVGGPPGRPRRVWACTVSPAGVASRLAGPWLWRTP